MNDEPALLAAIITQPEEDTPRLAYADFLDERSGPGDAHFAAYIRCNVALARGDEATNRAQRELIESRGWTWRDNPHNFGRKFPRVKFRKRRGFVEYVKCSATDWLEVEGLLFWHSRQGRPCPPMAQPITEVDFIPLVDDEYRRDQIYAMWQERFGDPVGCLLSGVLADLWPGVSFDWPGQVARTAQSAPGQVIDGIHAALYASAEPTGLFLPITTPPAEATGSSDN